MSDAKKCDRCKLFFESTIGCITLDIHEQVDGDMLETVEDNDLCPECSEEFSKFMEGRPLVQVIA